MSYHGSKFWLRAFTCAALVLLCACQASTQAAQVTITTYPTPVPASPTAAPAWTPSPSAAPTHLPAPALPRDPAVPSITPTPKEGVVTTGKSCRAAQGKLEVQQIDTRGEGISAVTVYLPPCYTRQPDRRYPVLYLLHGLNNDNQQWVRIGAPAAADQLIDDGQAAPFLIVMPREDLSDQNSDEATFENALAGTLVPWIDQHYATCMERSCRAIGGLSRGSGWAMRIGLNHWQLFGALGAHSYSPFPGDLESLPAWLAQSTADQHPRIYIDIGTYDQAVPDAKTAEETLTQLRVPHEWHLFVGAHNEDYWQAHIRDYLLWYSQVWK